MKESMLSKMLAATLAFLVMTCISTAAVSEDKGNTKFELDPHEASIPLGLELRARAYYTSSDGTVTDVTQSSEWSSQDPKIIAVGNDDDNKGICKGLSAQQFTNITANYKTSSTHTAGAIVTYHVTASAVDSIKIEPSNPVKIVGQTQQLDVYAVNNDGSEIPVTANVEWSSDDTSVANVSAHGVVLAVQPGRAEISATWEEGNLFKSAQTHFIVIPKAIDSIKVTPVDEKVDLGNIIYYKATAILNNGEMGDDITVDVVWSSSNHLVANVSNLRLTEGMVTVISYGNADITAKFVNEGEQLQDTAPLAVLSKSINYIEVQPMTDTAIEGNKTHYKAYAVYNSGARFDVTVLATWSSSDNSIATVGDDALHKGLVKTQSAGDVEITATHYNVSGSASLTVDPSTKNLR